MDEPASPIPGRELAQASTRMPSTFPVRRESASHRARASTAQAVAGPSITLAKSASPTRVSEVGQVVTYRFAATNNGSVPLSNVRITDELEGLTGSTCPSSPVRRWRPEQALSCSASLTVTQAILDFGDVYNFATVFGTVVIPETPDDYVGANAAARVTVDQSPSIALQGVGQPDRDGRPGRPAPLPRHRDQHRQRHPDRREDHQQPRFPRPRLRTVGPGDPGSRREHQLLRLLSGDHGERTTRPGDQRAHRPGRAAVRRHRLQQRRCHR